MELLGGVDAEEARQFMSAARRRRFGSQEVIFHEGDPADCLHLIVSGRVAVRMASVLGSVVTLEISGAGDVVGELALLEPGASRSATAVALEPTQTMAMSASGFAELRATHPGVDTVLLSILARRHRALMGRLVEALYVDAETRVLRRLAHLGRAYASKDTTPVIPLSQDDLAGLAGTTRETVNRVLRRESEQDTVTLARRRITIIDLPAIEARSR